MPNADPSHSERSILVTGGAGFIGSAFVRMWLRSMRSCVINLDKLTYAGHGANVRDLADDPRHVFVRGDIGDSLLVASLLTEHRPQRVVHFAAESHVDRSIDAPAQFVRTNVVGTAMLLEVVERYWRALPPDERESFRFLHVSTDEVYGPADATQQFVEGDRYRPSSPYAASKAAADHFVHAFHRTYGLPTLVTHCTNNYGPRQYPEKLIPLMIRRAFSGLPLPVYGDGGQVRDWLHVEDHCRALCAVLERGRPSEVYHIAGDEPRTNLEVVQAICRLVDREPLIRFVTDRPAHDRRYALDCAKITRELGWKPQVPFADGLARTVQWYLENERWVNEVTQGRCVLERLGLARTRVS